MSGHWYRSLYWRIAIGIVALLAATLAAQAVLFVWTISRSGPPAPGQPPDRFAQSVALDLADELRRDPTLNLPAFVHEQYDRDATHPFLIALADGRTITSGAQFPEPLVRLAHDRLRRLNLAAAPTTDRRRDRRDAGEDVDDLSGPGLVRPPGVGPGRAPRGPRMVPILVEGRVVGLVLAPPLAPFGFLWNRYARLLSVVAGVVLVLGTGTVALVIFGPARRRLGALESAASELGRGNLAARVPAQGGDEIAAVATAFNKMADRLLASDRARRQLLADVSHELMTPITAVRGYLETLRLPDLHLDAATRARYLAIVGEETTRLEQLVGDLLDLAKLEGGGGALNLEPVVVGDLLNRVVARHENAARQRGVSFATALARGAECVIGDPTRLEQAVQNLAANALRYAPIGSTVQLRATREGGTISISVEDAGEGIAPAHLAHVFDRFYKADPSRATVPNGPSHEGSGLGLSIVKAIAERHAAQVEVTSQPGRTVFTLRGLRAT